MQLNKENTRIETKGLVMVAMKQEKIGTRNGASTVHDVMSLAMDLTDVRSSVRGRGRYVPTGYVGYDQRVKGLALGKLSIIGSRAGEGHDVLSLDIARHAAAADVPSCFFCPDKSAIEIGRRIMSAEAGVPMETLFSGNDLDEGESVLCDAAYSLCERMPLYIKAGRSMDADCIAETCRGLKQTSGLKLVVVDGLPSIVDHVDDEPRVLEQFSKLARDRDVAVVLTDLATRGPLRKPGLGNLINGEANADMRTPYFSYTVRNSSVPVGETPTRLSSWFSSIHGFSHVHLNSVSSPNTRDSRITDFLRPDAQFW